MSSPIEISASEFKAKCLQILDDVAGHHSSVVVTKHGKPVARLVPIKDQRQPLGRSWEGSVQVHGDLLDFELDLWLAEIEQHPRLHLEPLTSRIIAASATLEYFHRDPADQLIVATAHCLGLPLVTVDERIRAWGGVVTI